MVRGSIQGFEFNYNKESKRGSIHDNGFSIDFEYSGKGTLVCSDVLDKDIYRELIKVIQREE